MVVFVNSLSDVAALEAASQLTDAAEAGLRPPSGIRRNSFILNASNYSPKVLWMAACELVAAGWVVHYGPCKSGRKYELPFTAFHVMTQAEYIRRARGEVQFAARTEPYLFAFVASVLAGTVGVLSVHSQGWWSLVAALGFSAASFLVAKLVRNKRVERLPQALMTVSVPFKPITRRVSWVTWLQGQH